MTKVNVYDRLRSAEKSPAWNRASAYVIMKGDQHVGKILCKHPVDGAGPLEVFVWDWTNTTGPTGSFNRGIQHGFARGYGYDKLAAVMEGMKFGDITLKDRPSDWTEQLRTAGYTLIQVL